MILTSSIVNFQNLGENIENEVRVNKYEIYHNG